MNQPSLERQSLAAVQLEFGGADELLIPLAYRNQRRDDCEPLLDNPYPPGFTAKHATRLHLLEGNLPDFDEEIENLIEENQLVLRTLKEIRAERQKGHQNSERMEKLTRFQRSNYILLAVHIEANNLRPSKRLPGTD